MVATRILLATRADEVRTLLPAGISPVQETTMCNGCAKRTTTPCSSDCPRMLAAMLGRFTVNLMHSFGAWQGIMLTGSRATRMIQSDTRIQFSAPFSTRRNFSRLIGAAPVWRVDQHEAVLSGAAERLAHEWRPELSAAA